MKSPILGSSYVARSVNAADNRMVNLFPEMTAEGGKEAAFLSRCPGLRTLVTFSSAPIQGIHAFGGYLYVVSGGDLYRVDTSWVAVRIGAVMGGSISMADNGDTLFIATSVTSYLYNSSTNSLAPIGSPDFLGAVTVAFIDTFFVFNVPGTGQFQSVTCSNAAGPIWPLVFDATDYATAEGSPDALLSLIADHREVWLFGANSVEVWYNAGGAGFAFSRIQGAFLELGCAAAFSVAKLDNSLFWLGSDDRGFGIVYRANGYSGVRVSTHAIEFAIAQYSTISDAIAYTYQQEGHSFYVLSFPTGNATWAFDVSIGVWHERAYLDPTTGGFGRHKASFHANFGGENVVGDYALGVIYAYDLDVYADGAAIQKWLRSWRALPSGQNNLKRSAQHSLTLDCQAGVGISTGQGSDPQVMLRWSDDGGHTWSNEHWRSLGAQGAYGYRTIWRRLGMTLKLRDRIYELSGTDPVKIAIMGAELELSPTAA